MRGSVILGAILALAAAWPVEAAITHVASTVSAGNSTRLRLTVPAGAAVGDVLLVKAGVRRQTSSGGVFYGCATLPAVTGWTRLRCDEDGSDHAQAVYWKYAVAGDPGKRYTWNFGSANANYAGGMSVYRGADPVSPIDAHAGRVTTYATTVASGSNLTAIAPSVTTTVDGDLIVALYGANFTNAGGGSVTPPVAMTERYERASGGGSRGVLVEAADRILAAAGVSGDRNATIRLPGNYAAPYTLIGQQVAIKPAVVFDHLRILHDGQGITCAPETITLQACADAACTATYVGPVSVTLSPTDAASSWSSNPISFSGGSATLSFSHTSSGTVTFGAPSIAPLPSAATRYRCYVGATETCSASFAASGFKFDVPDLTACKPSPAVTITALQTGGGGTCTGAFSGTKTVYFWSGYTNPASGAKKVSVNGTPVATASPGTPISLTFDGTGKSSFTASYPDAGQMTLNASYTSGSLTLAGSDGFVSAPAGIAVYGTASCAAGDASCPVFAKAGDPFTLNVKAACWQSDTDTDLSDNAVTPNFRMSGIALDSLTVSPAGGAGAVLGTASIDMLAADAGAVTIVDQTVSEVGVFSFTATPAAGGYFGLTVAAGTSPAIGRFTPHHFELDAGPMLTNRSDRVACASTFTYLSESFRLDYALLAMTAAGEVTTNYEGAYARLDTTQAASFGYGAASGASNLTSRLDLTLASSGVWSAGRAALSASLAVKRAALPDGPFPATSVGIAPRDTDGVVYDTALFDLDVDGIGGNDHALVGTSAFRYGRLRLRNAFGSELLDLPLGASLQHWNQYAFVNATDDNCSTFGASDIALAFPVSARNSLAACETSASVQAPPGLGVTLLKPGAGNNGWLDATLNLAASPFGTACVAGAAAPATTANMPYLMYDWNSASPGDENPSARASFGVYRGSGAVIYQRENY